MAKKTLRISNFTVLLLFGGDPFESTSHVCEVVIEGDLVSDTFR